ncbi:hypothetical protein [Micromonospora sp. U21]|uniref:hypothetical protein n=1 Tax=Micromonospora sp. U21 TaxID=2824899 RepID=UPI001B37513A|nr:hypothetical protein [Micromonospora sp. U21]MBQ0905310.1 hypothetical protein [Micromonospora sp. U21]
MRALFVLAGLLLTLTAPAGLAAPPAAAAPTLPETVEVSLDQSWINAVVGDVLRVVRRPSCSPWSASERGSWWG